jgi:predicted O-methyltransferase YrrM
MNATAAAELGTCGGGACLTMAVFNPTTQIVSVDIESLPQARVAAGLCKNLVLWRGDSIANAKGLGRTYGPFDLLFLDTTHEYERTRDEYRAWRRYMKPGGLICLDDLFRPGTEQFWNELEGEKIRLDDMHIGGSYTDGGFGVQILPST